LNWRGGTIVKKTIRIALLFVKKRRDGGDLKKPCKNFNLKEKTLKLHYEIFGSNRSDQTI
jgi:hypothetical protein